ncbi:HNH endonuclease [Corynebacterium diphtheriae]|nr:HNH endonuclease [Corynebacterium diphtheriae]
MVMASAVVIQGSWSGLEPQRWEDSIRDVFSPVATAEVDASRADVTALNALTIDDSFGDKPAYSRTHFGHSWADNVSVAGGHNGCDTRNDILQRDLTNIVFRPGTRNCVVSSGNLHDLYSGVDVAFTRGPKTSTMVEIDHVVALGNAWYAGAWQWDDETRRNFANDPINLQATTHAENQAKKAKTADRWMPSDPQYHCTYAQRQTTIKSTYGLTVTSREKDALMKALATCS